MTILDAFVAALGAVLTAGGLWYGCVTVPPGMMRWTIYGGCGLIATQFVLLPAVSFWVVTPLSPAEQYMAVALAAIGLKIVMEKVCYRWVRGQS